MLFVVLLSTKPGNTFQEGVRPKAAVGLPGGHERAGRVLAGDRVA